MLTACTTPHLQYRHNVWSLAGTYTAPVLANCQYVCTKKHDFDLEEMKLQALILQAVIVATATCQSLQTATGTSNAPIIDLGYVSLLNTVLDHKSEQKPHGTLPRVLSDFCSVAV